ncbi:hypothetical protein KC19_9G046100 [Ceratodon purpureus]|uniref:Plastid lipid-associated protein/fibrillin conserved domain-containing protein n=1 Tax=Ceratodon purpureus TaxID=3225 RepID=A0A8T0GS06_CERPU|nr:hypothetical protein KC19_9G046100 [Ceratodon purpureus]
MIMSTSLRAPCTEPLQRAFHQAANFDKRASGFRLDAAPARVVRCSRDGGGFAPERVQSGSRSRKSEAWRAVAQGREQAHLDEEREQEVERAKMDLLRSVMDTKRGAQVSPDQRAAIEEAMVGVERFNAGSPLVLDELHGTWLLQYTTAPDVISLLQAAELPLLQVGQVYQSFDCKGRTDGGIVENIVRWSVPGLLQANEGATLIVTAKFSVASPRSIVLQFEEARVGEVEISAELETFITPAILPRTFINLQILQFLRSLDLRFPLRGSQTQPQNASRAPIGAWYNLTFLDRNLLLGRALGTGGIFVFSRTQARRKST